MKGKTGRIGQNKQRTALHLPDCLPAEGMTAVGHDPLDGLFLGLGRPAHLDDRHVKGDAQAFMGLAGPAGVVGGHFCLFCQFLWCWRFLWLWKRSFVRGRKRWRV